MSRADFDQLAEQLRNWGRWGPQDRRGSLNHIGPEALMAASAEVRKGKLFALGLPFSRQGPQLPGSARFNPLHYVTQVAAAINPAFPEFCFTDDVVTMPLQCGTQWDALSHIHYDGMLYNGCSVKDCITVRGAAEHGIEHLANPGILSRGVLLDIARFKGVERLPTDYAISVDDLRACAEGQGVALKPGDILLVRTGHLLHFTRDGDRATYMGRQQPGLHYTCAEYLHDTSAAAVCADNMAVEAVDNFWRGPDFPPLPFHMLAIRDMGMPLGEMFNLEALADDCAEDGRYTFLIAAPPLEFTGAFGSPVNPLVLK